MCIHDSKDGVEVYGECLRDPTVGFENEEDEHH
jgi:hypothetical protein